MKQYLFTLLLFTCILGRAQHSETLNLHLQEGDAIALSGYFDASLDLTIPSSKGIYNKKQAEQLLQNFFSANSPKSYAVKHKGGSPEKTLFEIGTLNTSDKTYRTYLLYKINNQLPQIIELRIESEE
jgi:hypothetical protein